MTNAESELEDDIPKINSINITPPGADELDWTGTIMAMINKTEDGSIRAPFNHYPELEPHMQFIVGSFIHEN